MTIPRMVGLLVALTGVGLGVVVIRVDQAAVARRIQELQFRQTELHRQLWTQELELARLRSPGMIRERAERFGLTADAAAGGAGETRKGPGGSTVARKSTAARTATRKTAAEELKGIQPGRGLRD